MIAYDGQWSELGNGYHCVIRKGALRCLVCHQQIQYLCYKHGRPYKVNESEEYSDVSMNEGLLEYFRKHKQQVNLKSLVTLYTLTLYNVQVFMRIRRRKKAPPWRDGIVLGCGV